MATTTTTNNNSGTDYDVYYLLFISVYNTEVFRVSTVTEALFRLHNHYVMFYRQMFPTQNPLYG